MPARGCRYLCCLGAGHSSHLCHLWAFTAAVQRELCSLRQGQPAGFRYIPLSSVAEMLWKDLGQVQRKSTLAGRTLVFFFFQNALVKMRHNIQPGEALTLCAAEHTGPAKAQAPCPAVWTAGTQGLWPTGCYKRTEESKRRVRRDQVLF